MEKLVTETDLFDTCADLVSVLCDIYKDWEGVRQFKGTPRRIAEMYQEFCWSPSKIEAEIAKQLHTFEDGYDEMLVTSPITAFTLCPHHLLPVELKVRIGYVPSGRVLGLSKFVRLAEVMGKRPIMQEQYSSELADLLMERLKAKGVGVYVSGVHGCMVARGVKQRVPVVTACLRGCILSEASSRAEFYSIVRGVE